MIPDHGIDRKRPRYDSAAASCKDGMPINFVDAMVALEKAEKKLETLTKERDASVSRTKRFKSKLQEVLVSEFETGKPFFTRNTQPEVLRTMGFKVRATVLIGDVAHILE